jgi:hypothetical protein
MRVGDEGFDGAGVETGGVLCAVAGFGSSWEFSLEGIDARGYDCVLLWPKRLDCTGSIDNKVRSNRVLHHWVLKRGMYLLQFLDFFWIQNLIVHHRLGRHQTEKQCIVCAHQLELFDGVCRDKSGAVLGAPLIRMGISYDLVGKASSWVKNWSMRARRWAVEVCDRLR